MRELIQSIYDHGITSPLLLWERTPNSYVILSGHRRAHARLALNTDGFTNEPNVPALVYRDITLEEATVIMVDENAKRERILPSERAFSYKMKMDALKKQGKRTDLTSSQLGTKLESDTTLSPMATKLPFDTAAELGKVTGESRDQIFRYIRLTYLIPELLEIVDNDVLGFRAAVEISYLTEEEQKLLLSKIERVNRVPDLRQARALKAASKDGSLDENKTEEILSAIRYDDRVTFRLRPAQLKQLDEVSKDAQINRSEILRAYTSTGGAVYVGREIISEMIEIKNDIARLGNLMKMQQNRLDAIAENPFIASEDRTFFIETMEASKKLYDSLQSDLKKLRTTTRKLYDNVEDLNEGKRA